MADETPKRTPTPVNAAGSDNATPQDSGTPQTTPETPETDTASDFAATIEARILREHGDFAVNTLAKLTPEEARSGEGDWCDTHPDAVAYVKALA